MIEVNRNSIVIRDVDMNSEEFRRFKWAFSVYDKVAHKIDFSVYEVIDNNIYLPASVTPSIVQTYFPNEQICYNYAGSPNGEAISFEMKHAPRTDIQKKAFAFMKSIEQDSVRDRMLNLPTGTGKTFVSILTISYLKQRSLVVVDTIDLALQWKQEFFNHTNLTENDIFILSGMDSIEEAKKSKAKIFIALHKTLGMMLEKDSNSINALMHDLKIGIRVFDECHVNFKNICNINSLSNVSYSIYLTATPNRSDYIQDRLYEKIFGKMKCYNGKEDAPQKYHTVVMCSYNTMPTESQISYTKTKYGFSGMRWAKLIMEHPDKYDVLFNALCKILEKFKFLKNNNKVAIMLPTIEMTKKIKESLDQKYKIESGIFDGSVSTEEQQEAVKKQIFLTNDKMFGKAKDIEDLDVVINFVQLSSKVNVEQILGRLRDNPKHLHMLFDMTDVGFYQCKSKQRLRKRTYSSLLSVKKIYVINGLF